MTTDALKRCPFCKSDDLLVNRLGVGDEVWWQVYCDCCCAAGPSNPTKSEAVDAWNARAALAATPLEELVSAFSTVLHGYRCARLAQGMTPGEVDALPAVTKARAALQKVQNP